MDSSLLTIGKIKERIMSQSDQHQVMPSKLLLFPIGYLVILIASVFFWHPIDQYLQWIRLVPLLVVWSGMLGGVVKSLQAIFYHNEDWQPKYDIWQSCSGLIGAIYGFVSYLFLQAVLKVPLTSDQLPIFALAAFTLGYAQREFHALMQQIFSLIFQPDQSSTPKTNNK